MHSSWVQKSMLQVWCCILMAFQLTSFFFQRDQCAVFVLKLLPTCIHYEMAMSVCWIDTRVTCNIYSFVNPHMLLNFTRHVLPIEMCRPTKIMSCSVFFPLLSPSSYTSPPSHITPTFTFIHHTNHDGCSLPPPLPPHLHAFISWTFDLWPLTCHVTSPLRLSAGTPKWRPYWYREQACHDNSSEELKRSRNARDRS